MNGRCWVRAYVCGKNYSTPPGRIITGMEGNAPEWASITGMDIKINLYNATKFIIFTIIYVEISVSNDISPFEVHMSTVSGFLPG